MSDEQLPLMLQVQEEKDVCLNELDGMRACCEAIGAFAVFMKELQAHMSVACNRIDSAPPSPEYLAIMKQIEEEQRVGLEKVNAWYEQQMAALEEERQHYYRMKQCRIEENPLL